MAITSYSDLLPFVMAEVPACPQNLLLQALSQAYREFCYETEALIEYNTKFDLEASRKVYTVALATADSEIIRIYEVRVNSAAGIAAGSYGVVQDPSLYIFKPPSSLEFREAPAAEDLANGLEVDFVIAPNQDNASVINVPFLERWAQFIVAGALRRLLMMEGRPWTSPVNAARYETDWWRGVAMCRKDVYNLRTTLSPRIRTVSWI